MRLLGDLPDDVYPRPESRRPGGSAGDGPRRGERTPVFTNGTGFVLPVTVETTSAELLPANPNRIGLEFFHTGTDVIYLNFGAQANTRSVPLAPGTSPVPGYWSPPVAITRSIHGVAASAGQTLVIVEYAISRA